MENSGTDNHPARTPSPSVLTQRGTNNHAASASETEYANKKAILQDKYSRYRDRLNRKGVFDEHVNQTRSQTLFQAELGQFAQQQSAINQKMRQATSVVGQASRKSFHTKDRQPPNKAALLQATLEGLHETLVVDSDKTLEATRARERLDKVQRMMGDVDGKGHAHHAHHHHDDGRVGRRPSFKGVVLAGAASGALQRRSSRTGSIAGSESRGSDVEVIRPFVGRKEAKKATEKSSNEPSVSTSTTAAATSQRTSSKAPRSPSPQPASVTGKSSTKSVSVKTTSPPQHLAVPNVNEVGVSGWMQRSSEHVEYPQSENELRRHLKRRDENKRAQSPVKRYAKPWALQQSQNGQPEGEMAALNMEEIFSPATLSEYVRVRDTAGRTQGETDLVNDEPEGATTDPSGGGREGGVRGNTDQFTKMSADHATFVAEARRTLDSRRDYQKTVGGELEEGQQFLHAALHEGQLEGPEHGTHVQDYACESSDEDDDILFSDPRATHASPERAKNQATIEAEEACEVVECVVVCLCEHFIKKGTSTGPSRDTAVLRNVVLHGLQTLLPTIREEVHQREEDRRTAHHQAQQRLNNPGMAHLQKPKRLPRDELGMLPQSVAHRVLRSWSKGVEVLLMLELAGTIREPFSMLNDNHVDQLVRLYCKMHRETNARSEKLMERWRNNRLTMESLALDNDTEVKQQLTEDEERASNLVNYFGNVAGITADDLSLLDIGDANTVYRQRELAQTFLDRFTQFLPGHNKATGGDDNDSDDMNALPSGKVPPPPTMSKVEEKLLPKPSALKLKHVLLQYVGLLNNRTLDIHDDGRQVINTSANPRAINSFINVFRSSWGRSPLSNVAESEAVERGHVMEAGQVLTLIDAYVHLLNETMQGRFRHRVKAEKARLEELERRVAEEAAHYMTAKRNPLEVQEEEDRKQALQQVERQHLLELYTKKGDDPQVVAELRKAVENSDEWYGYESGRRDVARTFSKQLSTATAKSNTNLTVDDKSATGGSEAGDDDDKKSTASTDAHNQSGEVDSKHTRMEVLRIRKLQELEACWQSLNIAYAQRIALHDKWNGAHLEVKDIDRALKLYKKCCEVVTIRENSLQEVLANEKNPDPKQKTVKRHTLFNEMCAAGQRCEVVAKRLLLETGDELYYKNALYTAKLKDDFLMVSKMLRSPA